MRNPISSRCTEHRFVSDMRRKNCIDAFFALARAGLWEKDVQLLPYGEIDYAEILQLADEQSVVGLVAAGIEHISDRKPQKKDVLQFFGQTVQLEQRNQAMNYFIGLMVEKMRDAGIFTLLVKGQGIAQCYSRPLWRSSGDIDFFLDAENYKKAKLFLLPLSASSEEENTVAKHLGMTIDPWVVELHGTLHSDLSDRIDRVIDAVQDNTFRFGSIRVWRDDTTDVFLPSVDNDIIFIFTHILKHFFKGGIGLRQISDWCRLLWTYRDSIDYSLLKRRLQEMGLVSEWKAFAAYAIDYLGMPKDALPLYDSSSRWSRKARRINSFVLEVGNFGHNRDVSYYDKYPFLVRKAISFWRRTSDALLYLTIFPLDSVCFYMRTLINGFSAAAKGIG